MLEFPCTPLHFVPFFITHSRTLYDKSTLLCIVHWADTVHESGKTSETTIAAYSLKPLNPELNPICCLLALLGAHHFLHVSRIRVKSLTFRRLMSYIYGAPIFDVSRSHKTTQHSRLDSSGRVISSSQRPLPDNTRHSQQTNIHAPGGIRTHDLSRRAAGPLAWVLHIYIYIWH